MQTLGATDDLDLTTAAVVRNNRAAAAARVAVAGAAPKKGAQEALRRLERLMAPSGTHLEPALETRLLDSQKQEILGNRYHTSSWLIGAVPLGIRVPAAFAACASYVCALKPPLADSIVNGLEPETDVVNLLASDLSSCSDVEGTACYNTRYQNKQHVHRNQCNNTSSVLQHIFVLYC